MTAPLAPCSSCARHIYVDVAACPFCGAPFLPSTAMTSPPSKWAPRVAAILAMTALADCQRPAADKPPGDPSVGVAVPAYGVPPPPPLPPGATAPDATAPDATATDATAPDAPPSAAPKRSP